jgi:phage terminase large subunit-like protein
MVRRTNGVIEEYHRKIMCGEIIAGEAIKKVYSSLIDDMVSEKYIFDSSEAEKRIFFMEQNIRLTKSPFYGVKMSTFLWQRAFITALYSFYMLDGTKRFQELLLIIGRKNSKTETSSALALTEFFIGNSGSDIICASNDDRQAFIAYNAIDTMRSMMDPKNKVSRKSRDRIRNLINGSSIFRLSGKSPNKDGFSIDTALIDEAHEAKDSTLYKAIQQSQSVKDSPLLITITTAGFHRNGLLDEMVDRARKVINGEETGVASSRFLAILYEQDSIEEIFSDPSSWTKANPSLGQIKKVDYLEQQVDLARQSSSARAFVLVKDFCVPQASNLSWLEIEQYSYDSAFDIEDFRGCMAIGMVDLSQTNDMTGAHVMLMKKESDTKYFHSMYFIPETKLEGKQDEGSAYQEWLQQGFLTVCEGVDIDLDKVADWFYSLYEKYKIRIMVTGYDQKFSKQWLKRMDYYGFDVEHVQQSGIAMTNANKLFESDIKKQSFYYNNNPITRWHLQNTVIRITDNSGNFMLSKNFNEPTKRIDGVAAAAIGYEVYRRYRTEFRNALR